MFRTTCDFELLQEYLVKMANRYAVTARASADSRRDVPSVVELQRVGMGAALLRHPMESGVVLYLRIPALLVGSCKSRQCIAMRR